MNIPYKNRTYKNIEHAKRDVTGRDYDEYVEFCAERVMRRYDLCSADTVLDIGSGLGSIAKKISPHVHRVYCCDVNEDYLSYAEDNCKSEGNMSFHLVDNVEQPLSFLSDDSITKGYANAVFEHNCTEMIVNFLHELERVLKSGGIFGATYCTKNRNPEIIPHVLESNEEEITSALELLNFNVLVNITHRSKNSVYIPDGSCTHQTILIKK